MPQGGTNSCSCQELSSDDVLSILLVIAQAGTSWLFSFFRTFDLLADFWRSHSAAQCRPTKITEISNNTIIC